MIILEQEADTKKVRLGMRSSASQEKRTEYENAEAQKAAFSNAKVSMSTNTKEHKF